MIKQIEQVKDFHLTMNQVINEEPTKIDQATALLRLNLIQEELLELADGLGFDYIMDYHKNKVIYVPAQERKKKFDMVKTFDAVLDLAYVLFGSIVSLGLTDKIEEGFNEVHRSNMSKVCETKEQADRECGWYIDQSGLECHVEKVNGKFIIQRTFDNKTVKPSTYSQVDLKTILNK